MEQTISSDLIRGHIDTIILHTLLDGDKFAGQIIDCVAKKSDNTYNINQATLYSSLKRLENSKFVRSYMQDFASSRRKFFSITDKGKSNVEKNLSDWSFSRRIIDKLMDVAPQKEVVYVEKVVNVSDNIQQNSSASSSPAILSTKNLDQYFDSIEKSKENSKTNETSTQKEELVNDAKDINFRNIINGLIKASTIQYQPTTEDNCQYEVVDNDNNDVKNFNETIMVENYDMERSNNGKIDFGDLTLKAAKEGFKINISSKDSAKQYGGLYINKLNFATSFIMILVLALQALIFNFSLKINLFSLNYAVLGAILLVYPIFALIKFIKSGNKAVKTKKFSDDILTSAIIVFNLLFITLAINIFISTDWANLTMAFNRFILPVVIFVDIMLYFVFRCLLSKIKGFYVKQQNN